MANTVIALKKSATPSSVPADLANGELAINYADGKLYYKAANGTIASISGNEPNYFGTVNANNTLVVADTPGDVFTLASGNNIAIIGDAINDKITVGLTNDVSLPGTLTLGAVGGDEGGELRLANAITNSVLTGEVVVDVYQNKLRFFESGGTNRGAFINLASASTGVGTDLLAASSSTDTIARQWATGAFDKANNAYAQANTSRDHANAAFNAANSAVTDFSPAYIQANTARDHANTAHASANASQATANASYAFANSIAITANLAFIHANAAFDAANNAVTDFSPAFNQANTARDHANISFEQANTARDQANSAFTSSNAANTFANTTFVKLSSPNQTITGNLQISGNLIVSGNSVAYSVENLVINDSLILLANNNGSDIVDIGFIGHYINATGQNVHTGLYREHENKEYYLFQGYDVEPTYNHIGALSNNMTLAVLNADLKTSNLVLGGANAILTIGSAFEQANNAKIQANAAFSAANAALPNTSGAAFAGNLNLPTGNLAVGIATPNTGARLQVYNTTGNSELWITAGNGYDPTLRLTGEAGDIVNEGFTIRYDNSVGDTYFENKFNGVGAYHFQTFIVEALTIQTDGKVGVGTTSPGYILDVKGTGNVSSALLVNDMNVKPTIQAAFNKANTANITADLAFNKANAANVLAFNALPNTSGVSFAGDLTIPTNLIVGSNVNFDTSLSTKIVDPAANTLAFHTTQTERMRIDGSGRVGIGTTSLDESFQVAGAVVSSSATLANKTSATSVDFSTGFNSGRILAWGSSGVTANIGFWTGAGTGGATERMRIQGATGNVLIGRTDSTVGQNVKLDVAGAINASAVLVNGTALTSGATLNVVNDTVNATRYLMFANGTSGTSSLNVAVGLAFTPSSNTLNINGALNAVTKSFVIPHPVNEGMFLRYGSLEGPENGVYVRGKIEGKSIIELPEYWWNLIDQDTITVNLTPYGRSQDIWVQSTCAHFIHLNQQADCFFTVFAERKDVDKLVVEY